VCVCVCVCWRRLVDVMRGVWWGLGGGDGRVRESGNDNVADLGGRGGGGGGGGGGGEALNGVLRGR
jgi:hypothetical protein